MIDSHFKCQYTPFTVEWGCEADKRIAELERAPDLERTKRAMEIYKADLILERPEAWEKSKEQGE